MHLAVPMLKLDIDTNALVSQMCNDKVFRFRVENLELE